jgi:DNA-binding CsgD family transcriptional regulator
MTSIIQLAPEQEEVLAHTRRLIAALTRTEAQIARLASAGRSAKEVAAELGIQPKTVERHIESITGKARRIYGSRATFRGRIAAELYCYYFLMSP